MTTGAHDLRRLDVAAAAAASAHFDGRWPLSELTRLADDAPAQVDQPVVWSARFSQRREVAGTAQVWLQLHAQARVSRECQRCLQPVLLTLNLDRAFRFAPTEDEAAALDAESEDDVLVLSRQFNLQELIEDELLLALPIVPMHEHCPTPLVATTPQPPGEDVAPAHPFAALAALKRGGAQ